MWGTSEITTGAADASWGIEQNRWGSGGGDFEDHMRSIVPPAFRNGSAKVLWPESSSKGLDANDTLNTFTNWSTAQQNQYSLEPDLGGTSAFNNAFSGIANPGGWPQTDYEQQRNWDLTAGGIPSQAVRTPVPYCGTSSQSKMWPTDDQGWGATTALQRPPNYSGPPPSFVGARPQPSWAQGVGRGVFPPPTRFNGPPFDNGGMGNAWMQRPLNEQIGLPHAGMPPPPQQQQVQQPQQQQQQQQQQQHRSRLQNVWAVPGVNNVNGLYMPPPNIDYNVGGAMPQWAAPPNPGNAPSAIKPQFSQNFSNRPVSPAANFNYPPASKSDSFMGENAVWQDPEGEVRKWQRDTGTAIWGEPDKQPAPIKRWLVAAGKEYDHEGGRSINVVGWKNMPSTSTKNMTQSNQQPISTAPTPAAITTWSNSNRAAQVAAAASGNAWGNSQSPNLMAPGQSGSNANLWDLSNDQQQQQQQRSQLPTSWMQSVDAAGSYDGSMPTPVPTADLMRAAVNKGLIDVSLLSKPLPNEALTKMYAFLNRLPLLDQSEHELSNLMASVKISNSNDGSSVRSGSPSSLMTPDQRATYNRLVIDIAATKTELASIRDQIREACTNGNGRVPSAIGNGRNNHQQQQGSSAVTTSAATTAASPRFGDSILDVAVRVEQQTPVFSLY